MGDAYALEHGQEPLGDKLKFDIVDDCDLQEDVKDCHGLPDFQVAASGIVRGPTEDDLGTAANRSHHHPDCPSRLHPTIARVAVLALLILSIGMSRAGERGMYAFASLLLLTQLLPLWVFCRAGGLCFGSSAFLWRQSVWEFLVALISFAVSSLPWAFAYHILSDPISVTLLSSLGPTLGALVVICFSCRWQFFFLSGACLLRGLVIPPVWGYSTMPRYMPWNMVVMAIIFLLCIFMRYKKDQTSTAMLGMLLGYADFSAVSVEHKPVTVLLTIAVALLLFHIQTLWMRSHRQLPPGLRGCRFVSLAYLRKISKTSHGIRRCQDLPDEAFGDHTKARYLLAVSHRWLDPYTCDVKTAQHPQGFRCQMLLDKMNRFFSLQGVAEGWKSSRTWWGFLQRLQMATTPGEDVLIFFDYMSLPQETLAEDGSVLKRTHVERRRFLHCLPHMGALYSMFPVLVCEEVLEGLAQYSTSGWCFAEAATAWLSSQVRPYSTNATIFHWFDALPKDTNSEIELTAEILAKEMEKKKFVRQRDRRAVEDIIRGFALKRRLVKAIKSRDFIELQRVLYSIDESSKGLLDQPVDRELNTPLHLAVAHSFPDGVKLLLDCRAKPCLRNIRGDTPMQWYMFPRFSEAARLCKTYQARKPSKTTSSGAPSRDEEGASTLADESLEVSSRVHSALHTPRNSTHPGPPHKYPGMSWAAATRMRAGSFVDSSEDTCFPSIDLSQPNEDSSMVPIPSDPLKVSL